jgi:Rrf2 family nitric oxide-sensitive transcriptional repressor
MPPEEINVGAVVRHTEDGFDLADCGSCIVAPACGLTGVLKEALSAFMAVLDRYTLADLPNAAISPRSSLQGDQRA